MNLLETGIEKGLISFYKEQDLNFFYAKQHLKLNWQSLLLTSATPKSN